MLTLTPNMGPLPVAGSAVEIDGVPTPATEDVAEKAISAQQTLKPKIRQRYDAYFEKSFLMSLPFLVSLNSPSKAPL